MSDKTSSKFMTFLGICGALLVAYGAVTGKKKDEMSNNAQAITQAIPPVVAAKDTLQLK